MVTRLLKLAEERRERRERRRPLALAAGDTLIPLHQVRYVEIGSIEEEHVRIYTISGGVFDAYGFDAIEAVMLMKPSALEGRRLLWKKNAWAFHNFVGHPVVQILAWFGFKKQAVRFHDFTTPTPRGFRAKV